LQLNEVPIAMTDIIKILGVALDSNLSMNKFVSNTVCSFNFPIRALHHIRLHLTKKAAIMIGCSIIQNRLDYCNSLLHGTSIRNISRLQRVQNSLACVVCQAPYDCHALPLLHSLHWLPIKYRIDDKVAVST